MIRKMKITDVEQVLEIYRQGIETRNATFQTEVPTWEQWDKGHHQHSRLIYKSNEVKPGNIAGWAALSPVSKRACYVGVAELSIYIHTQFLGIGIGTKLMAALIETSERNGIWTLQSSVFPGNQATIKLHENFGFRRVGIREKIAQLDGKWRDTLILERRSESLGQKD
ncbi:GNAT family N-acetyltransferase [Aliikangiella coralliicola]|uniref:N-acetyltransferase n=1 Tax=Aliikangiella coralliicola TaxID=2592383 RepID=A0A545UI91_9GAMM|nr:GNAT family N-acetyltransferase [Aliikangiella coralliicola]TQV89178.1 N-acetyltransferase [Aliikangiella coralliicola]